MSASAGLFGGPKTCVSCEQLQLQNARLQSQIEKDNKTIDDLKNKQGYLVIGIWTAILLSLGLLAVGLAIGVKIKDEIITRNA